MTRGWVLLAVAVVTVLIVTGCKKSKPEFTFMPDMAYSPAIKAQEEGGTASPVKGTIARDQKIYPYPNTPEGALRAGRELKNPLKRTKAVLNRGKELYNIYCMVCHGQYGEGDGSIVPKFPRPPSLQTNKIKNYSDGRLFHIITQGQNLMPSYAPQIEQKDRWPIVHYLRVLYRAKHPTAQDLKAAENW